MRLFAEQSGLLPGLGRLLRLGLFERFEMKPVETTLNAAFQQFVFVTKPIQVYEAPGAVALSQHLPLLRTGATKP